MNNIVETKVPHPVFGHVIFHNLSSRQLDILDSLETKCLLVDDIVRQNNMLMYMLKEKDEEIRILREDQGYFE